MRVAVSGTHSVGKSTLVADIHKTFAGYRHEEEPYRALRDVYPIKFGKQSTRYCNGIQLFFNISRVQQYASKASRVVFDRSPVDYIAYSLYTAHHKQTDLDGAFVASLIEPVREALRFLDLIVFVPVSHQHPMHLEADGIRLVANAIPINKNNSGSRVALTIVPAISSHAVPASAGGRPRRRRSPARRPLRLRRRSDRRPSTPGLR